MNFQPLYQPLIKGSIRNKPEDFRVDEIPSFSPAGEGEHLFLHIKKTGANTDWLAGQLARVLGVKKRDVSYAGLKDRNAVTTQWFSVYLPGKQTPDVSKLMPKSLATDIEILQQTRHVKKLRRGSLEGNRFVITIRDCDYVESDKEKLEQCIQEIREQGIPNYFGEQRFGHKTEQGWNNIEKATAWFNGEIKRPKNRNQSGLYLSAARSLIFNHILSERITNKTWNQHVEGDVFMLGNSRSWFADDSDEKINHRLQQFDIHPSGALWGRGRLSTKDESFALENNIAKHYPVLCEGLERNGLKQERRSLRIRVKELDHQWLDESSLRLSFVLPAGSYATTLLEQIVSIAVH